MLWQYGDMKKYAALFIALFSISLFIPPFGYAQEGTAAAEKKITPTPTVMQYSLPYPGILPDSPLYVLKIFRDKFVSFLITDPLKRAEFNLLQADKRLQAGFSLFKKGNQVLAESTIAKGENYMQEAIEAVYVAKAQGYPIQLFTAKLMFAVDRHQQTIALLYKSAQGTQKEGLAITLKKTERFKNQVEEIAKTINAK